MKFFIRATVLLLLASLTLAIDRPISWTPPTQYVNGEALLEQDLDFYTVYCDGLYVTTIDSIIGTWSATVTFPDITDGSDTCWLTTTTLLGVESSASNSKVFTSPRTPLPPVVTW